MDARRCPNCNQPLSANSTICGICDETLFAARTQEKLAQSASLNSPRALNLRYRPLSESTDKNWAKPGPIATPTPKPEYESLSNVYISHLSQNQKLFRPPWQKPDYTSNYHFPPKILFWISSIILLVLVAGGAFGIAVTLGHGTNGGASEPVLQITPSQADRGALISLRGSHFSPGDVISLTRDNIIPLSDTAGKNLIQTDSRGNFSDTAWIDNNWSAGAHKIYAEDSLLHKVTYFNLYINGHGLLGRPPHLVLSANTLDFGPGDPATNSTKIIILSNSGGGSISWHAHADQPWLQFSPPGSSDASRNNPDTGLVIAANRTNLQPGDYHANLKIMSNAGQANISIKMRVVPFNPSNGAIFQVSPPVMSFTASPNGTAPATQTLQIANPGSSDLQWNLNTTTDTGGSWLYTTSSSGQVTAGNNQQIQIGINPAHLPVGTYKGRINLNASGSLPVQDNSQTIFVSLTIQPTCSLHASDSSLSFNLGGKQPTTANQPLYITSSANCASSMLWTASSSTTSGGNWLTLSSTNGMTPGTLHILVKSAGMAPGNYTGVLNLIDNSNQKLSIAISLLVSSSPPKLPPAKLGASPSSLSFSGNPDQGSLNSQTLTVTNAGGQSLNWSASTDASWFQLSAGSGLLGAGKSQHITISANTAGLATGDYSGTITLRATDANGRALTGEKISVGLHILAPCTLTASGSQLNFTATAGSPNPSAQTVTLTASSGCSQQVKWQVSGTDAWVTPTPNQATINGGGSGTLSVGLNIIALAAQTYTSTINITATDTANGQSLGSISITINLIVQAASITGTSTPTPKQSQTPTASSTPVSWMLLAREDPNQGF